MSQGSVSADPMPSMFAYIRAKAELYCKIGAVKYNKARRGRKKDKDAPVAVSRAIDRGMEQIAAGRGWTVSIPLEDVGIEAFYDFCELFDIRVVRQAIAAMDADQIIDQMFLEHIVTGDTISLFNKVLLSGNRSQ